MYKTERDLRVPNLQPQCNSAVANDSHEMKMADVIQTFPNRIKCGPEYICTCCDQL